MMRACREVGGERWRSWVRLLRGLWLSGLRLGEAVLLRWERGNWPHVIVADKLGWLMIPAAFDKSHRDRTIPLPPDFDAWLRRTPPVDRIGVVFQPLGERGEPVAFFRVSQVISRIGKAAKIVTDPASGRTATAHDLRRSFAQRWAGRLTPADLQRLMRHSSITTTLGYYTDQDSEGLAKRMQSSFTQH
jgi:integrase